MKKNITVICLNDFLRKETGKELAKLNKMFYLDVDELLDFELISRKQVAVKCGDEFLKRLEQECVNRVADYENCVISISADLFLANDNRLYLEDTYIVYLSTEMHNIDLTVISNKEEKTKLTQQMEVFNNINQFLIRTCPYIIKKADNKALNDVAEEIKQIITKK